VHNTLSATLITHGVGHGSDEGPGPGCEEDCGDHGGLSLVLGDPTNDNSISGRSAFIDDSHYAAIETPGRSTLQTDGGDAVFTPGAPPPTAYLVSGEQLDADNVLLFPVTNSDHNVVIDEETHKPVMTAQGFCNQCDFLKWGAWGGRASFEDPAAPGQTNNVTADIHLGWWVAGNVVSDSDLPLEGGANYAGHAIGTVANNLNGQGAITYVATGDMDMSWNFAERSGTLDITHFDTSVTPQGLSFGGSMHAPGVLDAPGNAFTGTITGQLPEHLPCVGCLPGSTALTGVANGSFAGSPGAGLTPSGVIGNWNIGNGQDNNTFTYGATGVFAGESVPQ